ncbi:hypothetical protein BT67DRAFT_253659 [Trichocladium antarcticum]|uniref:Uncharacterized protein n=1 Tax=Trichocladium antarcticum TaxID=1450529 RepID=A0AAN6UM34_9PEZI|nr:hypothetical protein BT67DRAFT_253659 [Trichocladium antarcticum]
MTLSPWACFDDMIHPILRPTSLGLRNDFACKGLVKSQPRANPGPLLRRQQTHSRHTLKAAMSTQDLTTLGLEVTTNDRPSRCNGAANTQPTGTLFTHSAYIPPPPPARTSQSKSTPGQEAEPVRRRRTQHPTPTTTTKPPPHGTNKHGGWTAAYRVLMTHKAMDCMMMLMLDSQFPEGEEEQVEKDGSNSQPRRGSEAGSHEQNPAMVSGWAASRSLCDPLQYDGVRSDSITDGNYVPTCSRQQAPYRIRYHSKENRRREPRRGHIVKWQEKKALY